MYKTLKKSIRLGLTGILDPVSFIYRYTVKTKYCRRDAKIFRFG